MDTCRTIVQALVISKLDYANGLLYGINKDLLNKLQLVQNMAAKLCLNRRKYDSSTDALMTLHWLPIRFRIKYKIVLIVFKCMHDMAPDYLKTMFEFSHNDNRGLRSNDKLLLRVPKTRCVTFGDRALSAIGPKLWNELPYSMRILDNVDKFKNDLKTFYFRQAFY